MSPLNKAESSWSYGHIRGHSKLWHENILNIFQGLISIFHGTVCIWATRQKKDILTWIWFGKCVSVKKVSVKKKETKSYKYAYIFFFHNAKILCVHVINVSQHLTDKICKYPLKLKDYEILVRWRKLVIMSSRNDIFRLQNTALLSICWICVITIACSWLKK